MNEKSKAQKTGTPADEALKIGASESSESESGGAANTKEKTRKHDASSSEGERTAPISLLDVRKIVTDVNKSFRADLENQIRALVTGQFTAVLKKIDDRLKDVARKDDVKQAKKQAEDATTKIGSMISSLNTLSKRIEEVQKRSSETGVGDDGMSEAAGSLAAMSETMKGLSDQIVRFSDNSEFLGKALRDAPERLSDISQSLSESSKSLTTFVSDLDNPNGKIRQFAGAVKTMSEKVSENVSQIHSTIEQAKESMLVRQKDLKTQTDQAVSTIKNAVKTSVDELQGKQNEVSESAAKSIKSLEDVIQVVSNGLQSRQEELATLANELRDALDTPHIIRDEVVPKLGKFFDSVAGSVNGLSNRVAGLKDQIDQIGDVSKFQEKALLAIRFGEVCKRLEEEFDKSLGQIDPPLPRTGNTDGK